MYHCTTTLFYVTFLSITLYIRQKKTLALAIETSSKPMQKLSIKDVWNSRVFHRHGRVKRGFAI